MAMPTLSIVEHFYEVKDVGARLVARFVDLLSDPFLFWDVALVLDAPKFYCLLYVLAFCFDQFLVLEGIGVRLNGPDSVGQAIRRYA